ncbi:MAG: hypothetical protein GY943_13270 [Chloroflexi bacterium]|nr:hypothetical protein [Chloroflexota bacterium]
MSNQEDGHGDDVFTLIELYYPKDGRLEDMMAITKASAKMVQGMPGLLQSQVLRPVGKGPISNISTWKSKAKFQAFMQSDEMKALLKSNDLANAKAWCDDLKAMMFSNEMSWHEGV